jgi:hypothetical protein
MDACKQREDKKITNVNETYIKCECGVTLQERSWSWHSMSNKHQDFVNEEYPEQIKELGNRMRIKKKPDYDKYRYLKTYTIISAYNKIQDTNKKCVLCECGSTMKESSWIDHTYTQKHIKFIKKKYPTQIRELGESDKFKNKHYLLKYRHFKTYVVADK